MITKFIQHVIVTCNIAGRDSSCDLPNDYYKRVIKDRWNLYIQLQSQSHVLRVTLMRVSALNVW